MVLPGLDGGQNAYNLAGNYTTAFAGGSYYAPTQRDGGYGEIVTTSGNSVLGVLGTSQIANTTIGCWFKTSDFSGNQLPFYYGNGGANGYGLYLSGATLEVLVGGVSFAGVDTNYTMTLNQYTRIIVTYETGPLFKLYINGALYSSGTSQTPITPVVYGTIWQGPASGSASLDDAFYATRAWTAADVAADYIESKTGYQNTFNRIALTSLGEVYSEQGSGGSACGGTGSAYVLRTPTGRLIEEARFAGMGDAPQTAYQDSVGDIDMTFSGTPSFSNDTTLGRPAFSTSNGNNCVSALGNPLGYGLTAITLAIWVQDNGTKAAGQDFTVLVGSRDDSGYNGTLSIYLETGEQSANNAFNGMVSTWLWFGEPIFAGGQFGGLTSATQEISQWRLWVVTWQSGDNIRLRTASPNGSLSVVATSSTAPSGAIGASGVNLSTSRVEIGRDPTHLASNRYFVGKTADVVMFPRVLSTTELAKLSNTSFRITSYEGCRCGGAAVVEIGHTASGGAIGGSSAGFSRAMFPTGFSGTPLLSDAVFAGLCADPTTAYQDSSPANYDLPLTNGASIITDGTLNRPVLSLVAASSQYAGDGPAGTDPSIGLNAMTHIVWIYDAGNDFSSDPFKGIVGSRADSTAFCLATFIENSGGNNRYTVFLSNAGGAFATAGSAVFGGTTTQINEPGVWRLYITTWESGLTIKTYSALANEPLVKVAESISGLNGPLAPSGGSQPTLTFDIGRDRSVGETRDFNGRIGDPIILNRALTHEERSWFSSPTFRITGHVIYDTHVSGSASQVFTYNVTTSGGLAASGHNPEDEDVDTGGGLAASGTAADVMVLRDVTTTGGVVATRGGLYTFVSPGEEMSGGATSAGDAIEVKLVLPGVSGGVRFGGSLSILMNWSTVIRGGAKLWGHVYSKVQPRVCDIPLCLDRCTELGETRTHIRVKIDDALVPAVTACRISRANLAIQRAQQNRRRVYVPKTQVILPLEPDIQDA